MRAQNITTIRDYTRVTERKRIDRLSPLRTAGVWALGFYIGWSTVFFTWCLIGSLINK